MKKIFTILLVSITLTLQAQEAPDVSNQNKHEFRLDAFEALVIPNIEINYEYVISRYSGVGAAISYTLDNEFNDYQKFAFDPYYRQYFLNKKDFGARGLFVEGVLRMATGEDEIFVGDQITEGADWFELGIGMVVGQKWVSDNGFVFEISIGGGRYLLDQNNDKGFVRGGILVGYRFF